MSNRLREFTRKLDDLALDAMLVTNEINVGYLTGFTGDSSFLWVESNSATLLSDRRYETQIGSECPDLQVAIRSPSKSMLDLVGEVVHGATAETVGVESADLSVETWLEMTRVLPNLKFMPTVGQVESLRVIKDAEEIERTRRAVSIAERAFQSVLPRLTPQWSEREVAFELEAVMRQLGASGVSFDPIVGAEPFGALPHYRPGANRIDDAATLLIDWGAKYCGYASDLTRTLHRSHASDAFRRAYDAVLAAQLAAIDTIAPGATASTVDAAARDCLVDAGYGDAFKHGLGHGTGLEIHEAPRLSAMSDEVLRPGMIITVEPGVYFEGDFGIRIEDDVLVTESGHEVLSTLPKGLEDSRLMM